LQWPGARLCLAIAVQPKTIPIIARTTIIIYILVVNNQNFDDTINIDITNSTSLPQYQANLAWLNWTTTTVFIPAGSHIYIPLKITIPSTLPTGTKTFTAIATSTANLATTAKNSGILSDHLLQLHASV
jgi:hypothetical protein